MTEIIYAAGGLLAGVVLMLCFITVSYLRNAARRRKADRLTVPQKRRFEFSKLLAFWAVLTATGVVIASLVLAAHDKHIESHLPTTVFTACMGYLITYAGKSALEKCNRNKYHLDRDGIPYEMNGGSDYDTHN
jgi:hypothetical protein